MMPYALIDRILDVIQKALTDLQVTHNLTHATIERWRWDVPQISLTWKGQDAIWRNIHVFLEPDGQTAPAVNRHIEINAWQDLREEHRWVRRWEHRSIATGDSVQMVAVLEHSYEVVAQWTTEDLMKQNPLP